MISWLKWFEEFRDQFAFGVTLIPQNLPSMIIEVLVLGFGVTFLVRSFEGRLEKRRFVREAAFETFIVLEQARAILSALSTARIDNYRDNRTGIEEQGARLHKLYDLNVKSLNPIQKRFYEAFLGNIDTLIKLLKRKIPGTGDDVEKATIIIERIKNDMRDGKEYSLPIIREFDRFAGYMWGILLPFSRPWGRLKPLARQLESELLAFNPPDNEIALLAECHEPVFTSSEEKFRASLAAQEGPA